MVGQLRGFRLGLIAILTIAGGGFAPAKAQDRCDDLLPGPALRAGPPRGVTATDLVSVRTIGSPDASTLDRPGPIAVSPDGSHLAFVLIRAEPATNDYCRGLVVMSVRGQSRPRLVDRGGDYISFRAFYRDLSTDVGTPQTVTPLWSPNGRTLFYLKRLDGRTSLWRINIESGTARLATAPEFDIESVVQPHDGGRLLLAGRPGYATTDRSIDREGLSGWHFDERVVTNYGARPKVREADAPLKIYSFDPDREQLSVATAEEEMVFSLAQRERDGLAATRADGIRATIEPLPKTFFGPSVITLTSRGQRRCLATACTGKLIGLWWNGNSLVFMRQEGWHEEATALYRWTPGESRTRLLSRTLDALQGCVAAAANLICTDESTTRPRRLVTVKLATGQQSPLFDPNPEFAAIRLGQARRLRWRNDRGLEAWGDLVLPPGHRPGHRVPLVVVQYHSRGFLRGGTNDEYPVFLLAEHGMAVLSLERPEFIGVRDPNLTTIAAVDRVNIAGWTDHASLFSSLKTGVEAAISSGVADPSRLGISGVSDGATLARYALINSRLFKAAAISSCCLEPNTVMAYGGLAWAQANLSTGFPSTVRPDAAFWKPMSLALNADRIDTPLLMQLADREYILAMEAFNALRERGKPVDMFVFPGEGHGKSQPAHRLAIYERSVDWFAFWLRNEEDPSPAKRSQYQRWEAMRRQPARLAIRGRAATPRRRPAA
ncbi:MAG: Atxe2 family lasso peptide isopeptidase [Sphingomonadaceae bacterium]|nr:Atxe2 family lasso peptide isopeptidase [Sphingomonadaceae bacterium]